MAQIIFARFIPSHFQSYQITFWQRPYFHFSIKLKIFILVHIKRILGRVVSGKLRYFLFTLDCAHIQEYFQMLFSLR